MRALRTLALAFLIAVVTALAASAQFDVNGPNARLTMQGNVPGTVDPIAHDVGVPLPGNFDVTIDSGANPLAGIIMVASLQNPNGTNRIVVPWGGSVDAGNGNPLNVILIADGLSLTVNPITDIYYRTSAPTAANPRSTFTQILSVAPTICGLRAAWQAIVADPMAAPFFLDCTECGDANFATGQQLNITGLFGGFVNVPFTPGSTFDFHGVSYTDIWVSTNGFVSFGAAPTVNAGGFTVDAVSWMNAQPSIALCMTDWAIGSAGPNDGAYYSEIGGRVFLSWGDPRALPSGAIGMAHFADTDRNNQLDLTLDLTINPTVNPCVAANPNAGQFTIAYPRFDATTVVRPGDGIMGHTPGGAALFGFQASSDIEGSGPTTTVGGQAALEEHNRTGGNATTIGWNGVGGARVFNEFRNWQGNAVTFVPRPALVPGATGYVGTTANPPADVVLGISANSVTTTGGTIVTATGKFFGFGAGTVTVTDGAGNAALATIGAITGGTGPVFTNEQLTFTTPALLATGNGTVRFNFASGYTRTFNVLIVGPCQIAGPQQTQLDDSFITAPLTVPVRMYGTNYTTMYLAANGTIDFGAGNGSFSESLPQFFNGHGFANNPGVAYLWCDLNPNFTGQWQVIEDTCTGTVTVAVTNQEFWNSNSPAGSNTVIFGASGLDSVYFDYTGSINDSSNADTPVIGYTDGNFVAGSNTNLGTNGGFAAIVPGVYSTGMFGSFAPDSVAEQFQSNTYATILQTINGTGTFTILNDGLGNLTIF